MEELLFFDIEVFKYQSMVVFKNLNGETVRIFTNSLDGLGEYVDKGILTEKGFSNLSKFIEDKTLVGYNNYHYDDYILYAMSIGLSQKIIKKWNDAIIQNDSKVNMKQINNCKTLDCFQQIDVSKPSLKKIEGNMGKMIYESNISFDIDRKLTPSENLESVRYCEYDVLQTIEIYKLRKEDYFEVKDTLIDMMPEHLQEWGYKWNTTSIIGTILAPKRKTRNGRLVSDEMLSTVPKDVQEMWKLLDTTIDYKFDKNDKKRIVNEYNNIIEFGWGGLHGAPKGVYEGHNVKLLDVSSMYPNILIALNGLGEKTPYYKEIMRQRFEYKRSGDNPKMDKSLKLILNTTYGLLNNQFSRLDQPSLAYSICIYGQISLYELTRDLTNVGCRVFNINTDGVAFEPDKNDKWRIVWENWEKKFPLKLDLDEYKYWRQKDVNNYVAVTYDGKIKVKGGDVNKYKHNDSLYFKNYNTRIIDIAIVEKIVYEKDIADTIIENLDKPILYQYILQAGGTYKGTFDNKGNQLQKINRVFASKDGNYEIFKKRQDNGLVKFADAPNKMYLYNGDLEDFTEFREIIDIDWYYQLATHNYNRWKVR